MTTETQTEDKVKNATLAILLPPDLNQLLADDAETSNTSKMAIVRGMIAERYNYTLPVTQRGGSARRKYATPEEREEAQKAQAKTRREKMSTLMELFNEGKVVLADGSSIDLDALIAQNTKPAAADSAEGAEG